MKTIEFQYEVIDEIWSEYPRPQLVTVNPQTFYNFCKEAGENNEISYNEAIRNLDKVLPKMCFFPFVAVSMRFIVIPVTFFQLFVNCYQCFC